MNTACCHIVLIRCQITRAGRCAELVMERAVPHDSVEVAGHHIGQVGVAAKVRLERG